MADGKKESKKVAPLITKLQMDPDSDAGKWVQQQYEAGVDNKDILFVLAESDEVKPAKFKRVPID